MSLPSTTDLPMTATLSNSLREESMQTAIAPVQRPRKAPRKRVFLTAKLFTSDGVSNVRVRDLSKSGARVFAGRVLAADCDVIFKRGSIFAAARVVWSKGAEAGLGFYRDLSDADVSSTLPSVAVIEPPVRSGGSPSERPPKPAGAS